uniref:Uncharacterized protein n=2 Tax=Oryza TaxID=4527 RepID=Q53JL5_ORYSJ|nr:hypothetical protein LOC_Os11g14440 [Oryza sativa Japonica Group]
MAVALGAWMATAAAPGPVVKAWLSSMLLGEELELLWAKLVVAKKEAAGKKRVAVEELRRRVDYGRDELQRLRSDVAAPRKEKHALEQREAAVHGGGTVMLDVRVAVPDGDVAVHGGGAMPGVGATVAGSSGVEVTGGGMGSEGGGTGSASDGMMVTGGEEAASGESTITGGGEEATVAGP